MTEEAALRIPCLIENFFFLYRKNIQLDPIELAHRTKGTQFSILK